MSVEKIQKKRLDQILDDQAYQERNQYTLSLTNDHTMMASKKDYQTKLHDLFMLSGFSRQEEIPESASEEILSQHTQAVGQKKLGTMEMMKAKREYKRKRKNAAKYKKAMDAYYEKINEEELAVDNKKAHELRDEWNLMKLYDTKEEQQAFMDKVSSDEKEKVLTALEGAFEKLRKADLTIFSYEKDEDLFKDYEKKQRLMDAGITCRKLMGRYVSLGGVMDSERYNEMMTITNFLGQQESIYVNRKKILLHPMYLTVRDQDLEKLTWNETCQRIDALSERIKELGKNENPTEEEKKELSRLMSLRSFLENVATEKSFQEDRFHQHNPQPGENMEKHKKLLEDDRKQVNREQWAKNLEDFAVEKKKKEALRAAIYEGKDFTHAKGIWQGAGLYDRIETHVSMIELIYLSRFKKSIADLEDPKCVEELRKIRDEVEGALQRQKETPQVKPEGWKEDPEDVETFADILTEMIQGFLLQFSVLDKKPMYRQFLGISKMTSERKDSAVVGGWGLAASRNATLGQLAADLRQIAEKNETITSLALSRFKKEEIELLRQGLFYADHTGGMLQVLHNGMKKVGLTEPDGITPDSVAGVVDAEVSKDERVSQTQIQFQAATWFFSSLHTQEKELEELAKGKKEWKFIPPQTVYNEVLGHSMDGKQSEMTDKLNAFIRSEDGKKILKKTLERDVTSDLLFYMSGGGKLYLNQDGRVDPPAGY